MRPLAELLASEPLSAPVGGKEDKGHVLVIGGPPACPGAALLTGVSALRCGAGRVQLCVDPSVAPSTATALPESAVFGWDLRGDPPAAVEASLGRADVVVVGVGFHELDVPVVTRIAQRTEATLILDAGAVEAAGQLAADHDIVVAPNPSEALRLLGATEPSEDGETLAQQLAAQLQQPVAVRGRQAVVASGSSAWCFDELPPGLGTPGSGDVFVGTLAALLGNGTKPAAALGWAIWLHAHAASRLAEETPVGYLARDVARELPWAFSAALASH